MAKYRVYLQTVASTSIEVEADDKDAALEAAVSADMPTICVHCSGYGDPDKSLELGDEWDISQHLSVDEAVQEVTATDA